MLRSSGRGQTEPLAALVAVVAVGLGLSLYVGVLDAELAPSSERNVAASAIERVEDAVAPSAVAHPDRIDDAQAAGPVGYRTNVTLTTADQRWRSGPSVPENADSARKRLGVRIGPSRIRAGTLRVRVWT
jgi:hypothetical protein